MTYAPPPQCTVEDPALQVPPFRLTFPPVNPNKRPHPPAEGEGEREGFDGRPQEKAVVVTPYVIPNRGPYPFDQPKRWVVRLEWEGWVVRLEWEGWVVRLEWEGWVVRLEWEGAV